MPVVAIVLDLPATVVLARNAARTERVVDPAVVRRHLATLRATVDDGRLAAEGLDAIVVLATPDEVDVAPRSSGRRG